VLLLLGLLLYARTMCLKAWSQRGRLTDLLERERRVVVELREVNHGKEQFVAVASHEMRTPLTAILGYVTTLRRQPIDDPAARDRFLEIVERQAQRLLLENAVKYSPRQQPCELGVRPDGDRLVLWVRDHGAGIPQSELDRTFDRFYQVDDSDTRPATGIGLGLHLVRELVGVLGGTIEVETRPGAGSRFTVVLPVRHPGAGSPMAALAAGAASRETRPSGP
jgi:signal transduction histidine kinase